MSLSDVDTMVKVDLAGLIAEADRIGRLAAARGAEIDEARSVPESIIQEIHAAGLLKARVPTQWGGYGLAPSEHFPIIYTLARHHASTAWVYCVLSAHAAQIADFPAQAQREVWASGLTTLSSSSYAPAGKADVVDGGYQLAGTFNFSSGCDHAQWAIVGGTVPGGGGAPDMRLFLIAMKDLAIIDDWTVMGLSATGSKTLTTQGMFVPEHRVRKFDIPNGAVAHFGLCTVVAGAALGAALDFARDVAAKPAGVRGLPSKSELIQNALGAAHAEAEAAWLVIQNAVRRSEPFGATGNNVPPEILARARGDIGLATKLATSSVERLLRMCGGSVIYERNTLQRRFRDIVSGAQHMALNPETAAIDFGAWLLASHRR